MTMQSIAEQAGLTQRERELGGIISAYNDVTERLKSAHDRLHTEVAGLHEELRRKNAELRRRERLAALGEMAAGLAHEIRNPLGGIALYASMLEKQLARRPKAHSAVVKISQGVRSLERLVSEILDFAQDDRLDRHDCQLDAVLSAVEDSARPCADEHGVGVTFHSSEPGSVIHCDPLRLRQAVLNLVINGIQAAGDGGRVWVSAQRRDGPVNSGDSAGEIRIEVTDDGPGIPAECMDRIFNPFFTTRDTGTGLGLAIVHRIVEAHGGTIRAGNRHEGGAAFVLRLPQPAG